MSESLALRPHPGQGAARTDTQAPVQAVNAANPARPLHPQAEAATAGEQTARQQRVARIKAQVASGAYRVDAAAVAEKMIAVRALGIDEQA
ncbi:MAG: hypothetical protein KatS3mg121_0087 [Gammaproteobacteria bacterium]|nr:MAG: hypothetical protein KatS3mg121_0087 [Gammaproteobacteria bacterium]